MFGAQDLLQAFIISAFFLAITSTARLLYQYWEYSYQAKVFDSLMKGERIPIGVDRKQSGQKHYDHIGDIHDDIRLTRMEMKVSMGVLLICLLLAAILVPTDPLVYFVLSGCLIVQCGILWYCHRLDNQYSRAVMNSYNVLCRIT